MTTQTMQQAAAYHFVIAWDELNAFEQAHWEAAYRAGSAALIAENERLERKNANQVETIRQYQDQVTGGEVSLGMLNADIRWLKGERDQLKAENEALRNGLVKIIEMNRQHAEDQYGDANKAESWSCVTVAREAMAKETRP